ncbi:MULTISPECIES: capsular polysaccharide biosynthesis protein [unclassified Oceanobacter]|uniref:capsular polysaccharide biosynthesis protein n=2 Tax=Gammaproteobacteria TaxID=1236 RepID=UPI0027336039|nr:MULTISPECIES: capsular polysaccharide biosynthesis protein [unclassified Oceanobacter]MDP2609324.1 capsular polysaccharide biosynthesis protein [Oceanobacter sp. 1_MG-2023]MDP2612579.1 capsular polysaccharide biosynthesis protein [Oceanobacter sp. 2_MG-2023]
MAHRPAVDSAACSSASATAASRPRAASSSRALLANPIVRAFWQVSGSTGAAQTEVLGWGRKRSGRKAQQQGERQQRPWWLLEDGFVRSLGREDPALSLVQDNLGIYYDATGPSRLEQLIPQPLTDTQQRRSRQLIQRWQQAGVSKYNAAPDYRGELPASFVLVVDQVAGDASISFGLASAASFTQMLDAALSENPEATVVLKVHPDAFTRARVGHFDLATLQQDARVQLVAENCHPERLLANADKVYTVTSQMGFEALLWGKPVRCFGMPFYAGWGLTRDELDAPERRRSACQALSAEEAHPSLTGTAGITPGVTLEQLVHATLVEYSRYWDPEQGTETSIEDTLDYLSAQRQQWLRSHQLGPVYALGFSRWKKPILRAFLYGTDVTFCKDARLIPAQATVALWGVRPLPPVLQTPERQPGRVVRIEDGFLRSSGLGADLIRPLSWVLDDVGMYYDASRPSRLEQMLAQDEWSAADCAQARQLRKTIVANRISKYNLTGQDWQPACRSCSGQPRRVVLVPGQVESDASIRMGAGSIKTNQGLLQAARAAEPDAWLVYKPHPDVVSGLRSSDRPVSEYQAWCDELVLAGDSSQMLEHVDAVHTMTSLLGFEALLRGKEVICHGMPFYAGWGLTRDMLVCPRRGRQRSLDELVAATLIRYPGYVSASTGRFSSPQRVVAELQRWKASGPSVMPLWRRALRVVLRLWVSSGLRKNA